MRSLLGKIDTHIHFLRRCSVLEGERIGALPQNHQEKAPALAQGRRLQNDFGNDHKVSRRFAVRHSGGRYLLLILAERMRCPDSANFVQ